MRSFLNWLTLQPLWLMLRVARACNPALRRPFVLTLSSEDFTIVFWPAKPAIPWHLRASRHMSMVKLSTWWSHRWRLLRMLVQLGWTGVVIGDRETPSTSNSPEQPHVPNNGGKSHRGMLN